jgi:hypothetical protein
MTAEPAAGYGPTDAPSRLRVEVGALPNPGLLRAAIEARLAGRPWASGPEAAVADEVARAVEASGERPWH